MRIELTEDEMQVIKRNATKIERLFTGAGIQPVEVALYIGSQLCQLAVSKDEPMLDLVGRLLIRGSFMSGELK